MNYDVKTAMRQDPHNAQAQPQQADSDGHPHRNGNAPTLLQLRSENIPDELTQRDQWVCWKLEWDDKRSEWTKVPYNARTGNKAQSNNPKTWSSFAQAIAANGRGGYSGVGFVVSKDDPITAGDLDHCIDPATGEIEDWALQIAEQASTYTEITPSGTGLRFFTFAKLPPGGRKKGNIEFYDDVKFLTVTGHHLQGTPQSIEQRQAEIEAIHASVFPPARPTETMRPMPDSLSLTDNELLQKAFNSKNGHLIQRLYQGDTSAHKGHSEADQALCCHLAFYTRDTAQIERLVSASGLNRDKWEKRADYRERTIRKALETVTETYSPMSRIQLNGSHLNGSAPQQSTEDNHDVIAADETVSLTPGFPLDDVGNGQRFASQHGHKARYCSAWGRWLIYDGCRWMKDEKAEVEHLAKITARLIVNEAQLCQDDNKGAALLKHAASTIKRSKRETMLKDAISEPGIAITTNELDIDPWLLNCENGTLDLRTGELRPHDRADLLTKRAPVAYDPLAECPTFLSFLDSIMAGRAALVEFLQRAIGYSLTGDIREQVFFILHGAGANGKSTLLNILSEMLGDYAQQTDTDALMVKQGGGINNDVARLRAARFVSAVETEEGKRLAEVKIKQFTGGDTVTARFLFQEFFEFKPLFKLFLATNHKPEIKGTDNAIWRRVRLVPFDVTFAPEQQDKTLTEKLRAELPGILAWAVQGCFKWQREGLGLPDEVKAATKAYREEQDLVALFLADCCVIEQHAQVTAKNLNAAYQDWCKAAGEKPVTAIELGKRLAERGLRAGRGTGGVRKWVGIGLQSDPQTSLLSDTNSDTSSIVTHSDAENDLIAQNTILAELPEKCVTMRHSGQNASLLPENASLLPESEPCTPKRRAF